MRTRVALASLIVFAAVVVAVAARGSSGASFDCPTTNPPNELVLAGGSRQTAQLGKVFLAPLEVQLANTNGCPLTVDLAGYEVSFDAPASGASGIFATSGSPEADVDTDAQGIATAPAFTANFTAGSYTIAAHADVGTVELRLTNTVAGLAASIAATGGTPQEAALNGWYPQPLQARIVDANGNPVQGASVSFSIVPGATGAGATFLGGEPATATTDSTGLATSPPLVATGVPGRFTAIASTEGLAAVAVYRLDNHADVSTALRAIGSTSHGARVDSRYTGQLTVRLLDADGQSIEGATVTFTIDKARNNATAAFADGTNQASATTNGVGVAAAPAMTANGIAGTFNATATVTGSKPASFTLRNRPGRPAAIATGAADGTSTAAGTRLPVRLAVTVTDENGNPVAGALVRFIAPRHGPGGHFATAGKHARRAVHVRTNAAGIAVAPPFTANRIAGGYAVRVGVGSARAAFALVNSP